jgi:hypothetical protein
MDAYGQLVTALRAVIAAGEDPWCAIDQAMEDIDAVDDV